MRYASVTHVLSRGVGQHKQLIISKLTPKMGVLSRPTGNTPLSENGTGQAPQNRHYRTNYQRITLSQGVGQTHMPDTGLKANPSRG